MVCIFLTDGCNVRDSCNSLAGPCQFPTLGFVVSRYNMAKNFRSEPFWYIFLSYASEGQSAEEETVFIWRRGHLFDFDVALTLYELVVEEDRMARVTSIIRKQTKKW